MTATSRDDLRSAAKWYEGCRAGLGRDFLAKVRVAFARIADGPKAFPAIHCSMRRAQLHRFPYGVFFIEESDRIVILGVIDLRRHPRNWKRRFPR
jgi:toxin ParE1/3/4